MAERDHRHARALGLGDADLHRLLADDLAEAAIAVDDGERVVLEDGGGVRVDGDAARLHQLDIERYPNDAMRIMADEIGADETLGDRRRLALVRARLAEDGAG